MTQDEAIRTTAVIFDNVWEQMTEEVRRRAATSLHGMWNEIWQSCKEHDCPTIQGLFADYVKNDSLMGLLVDFLEGCIQKDYTLQNRVFLGLAGAKLLLAGPALNRVRGWAAERTNVNELNGFATSMRIRAVTNHLHRLEVGS